MRLTGKANFSEFEIQNQMEMGSLEGSTEMHHVRWNAFESNAGKTFGDLKEDKNFEDVTLVCEGQQLQANKVVLSVASSFFHRILKQNPHPHPLICLVGIKFSHLNAMGAEYVSACQHYCQALFFDQALLRDFYTILRGFTCFLRNFT